MGPHWPTRAAYSWRPGFIHFLPIGRIQRRDNRCSNWVVILAGTAVAIAGN
jgi:hypothetical protein